MFTIRNQEMKNAFEQESLLSGRMMLLLTAAVGAGKATIDNGYAIPILNKLLYLKNENFLNSKIDCSNLKLTYSSFKSLKQFF